MASSIGIYFGGTTSCVSIHKDGKTDVVANDAGDRTTPSVVAYNESDKVVGLAAKQGRLRNPVNTIQHVKHIVGRQFQDEVIQNLKQKSQFKVVESKGLAGFEVELNSKKSIVSSAEVTVLILKKLKEIAEHQGAKSTGAVITVPVDFSEQQRDYVGKAAEAAGFQVLRLISEPSAAVLAYDIGVIKPHDPCNVLVYRLGGSTVSVSIINVTSGLQRVIASRTFRECSGDDFTRALAASCAEEFKRKWKVDATESKRSMGKLYNACENCKHVLSTINTSTISVESLHEGIDFNTNVTRAKFESVISNHLQRCLEPISTIMEEYEMTKSDIHKVIITGGSCRIPKVQNQLRDRFPEAEFLSSIAPEEVVSIGAALQAAILQSKDDNISCNNTDLQTTCTAKSIFIKVLAEDGSSFLHPIVPKYTYIPLRQQHHFTVPKDQDSLCLRLEEGEPGCLPDQTTPLGQIILRDLVGDEPQEGKATLDVHLKRDGTLEVTCSESVSGSMDSLVVSPSATHTKSEET